MIVTAIILGIAGSLATQDKDSTTMDMIRFSAVDSNSATVRRNSLDKPLPIALQAGDELADSGTCGGTVTLEYGFNASGFVEGTYTFRGVGMQLEEASVGLNSPRLPLAARVDAIDQTTGDVMIEMTSGILVVQDSFRAPRARVSKVKIKGGRIVTAAYGTEYALRIRGSNLTVSVKSGSVRLIQSTDNTIWRQYDAGIAGWTVSLPTTATDFTNYPGQSGLDPQLRPLIP